MTEQQLAALVGAFGGVLFGLAARLGRFCTLGSVEDFLYGGSSQRLRMWGVAIGTATIGSFLLVAFGLLDISQTIYSNGKWNPLSSILGGLMFGYGMALAGNCGFGALARFGGGDLRSFVIVLVMGIAAYTAISGPLALLRVNFFEGYGLNVNAHGIAGAASQNLGGAMWIWGILAGAIILIVSSASSEIIRSPKYLFWGMVVGLGVVSGWAGTQWIANEGFSGLPVVSHTFSSPLGETMIYVMTSTGGGLSFGVGSVVGVLTGAFIGSLKKGHFRWEACDDPRELRRQILGACLMGVGAVLALGCTIGQGVSAFSVLSFSAPVVFMSIFAGAAIGLRQLITGFGTAHSM